MRLKRLSVSYNADNQLLQYPRTTPFSAAAPADTSVSFTPQGHTAQEKSGAWQRDYRYNAAERLIETSQNGQTTSYRYDPFGRRISKTTGSGAGSTTTTYFLYSDTGLLGEADSQGNLTKAYGFNPKAAQQGLWSTDPIWQANVMGNSLTNSTTSYHYLHTDHLATPILATDKAGNATWKGTSEAFGATMPTIEATEMNLRFPGQYWDRETNTHYNFHRDYLPGVGRYLQGDPIGVDGGLNIFAYADANPVIKGDPNGRHPVVVILIIYGKLVLRCELIHQSYKHLESNVCRRCGGDCDPTEAAANCACWASVVQLRKNYLKGKCDYILPGSIAKGSKKAEQSHNFELTKTIQARNKCCGKALLDSID